MEKVEGRYGNRFWRGHLDRPAGPIEGNHCWAELSLPAVGWFPIGASEAARHPEPRGPFRETHRADRIPFTVGRDPELGTAHTTAPLNAFIYPHVELAGERLGGVKTEFRVAGVPATEVAARPASGDGAGPRPRG
jgi:hypothetical protein